MDEPDAVEMAIWFHDVIYDAKATDNELKSAELFTELAGSDVSAEFNSKVRDLILVTIHRHLPKTRDEKFVVDIDLSSFGLPWDRFLKDSDAVRQEFPHLSDEEFYPTQKCFLNALTSRESFCFTDFFRDRHEDTARENISQYLDKLKQRGLIEN
jgi:predicted metal-dependent HD superfamily phosphohydrolase